MRSQLGKREDKEISLSLFFMNTSSDGLTKRGVWCKKPKRGPSFSVLKKVAEAIFSV